MRNKKQKNLKLLIVLILLVTISIGYAALSTTLTMNGTANIAATTWNVHFDNVQVKTGSVSGAKVTTAPTTSGTTTTTLTWEVSMDTPGEFYEFNVDVVNGGSIDAMVQTATNSIVTSTLTAEQQEYLDYTIKYVNGADIEQYDKLAAGETKTLTVKLLFKQDIDPAVLPGTEQNGISLSYSANYVQADNNAVEKVTALAEPLGIGETVDYTTTLNGVTLDDWSVFYVDGDYTYLIYGDYLPNAAVSEDLITTHNLGAYETYGIYTDYNREYLISAMTTKSNWDSLLTGTINGHAVSETRTANVWAMGAPTVELWVNSWNASYPSDTLYTRYVEDIDYSNSWWATGYAIGDSVNPTTTYIDLSEKTGYDNTLYYPHHDNIDDSAYGYLLASPSAGHDYYAMTIGFDGIVDDTYYISGGCYYYTFRPVVCLPTSVVNQ